ncbi:Rho GTP binding protein RhoU [Echinococcus multilocularis]|uniref:Rho GTP binding protein RhoU n=1 Tax=Echinococcus multilocularis TaxID=6211 RepID=A0A087W0H1_ECHMU|nr:Rho GTP binding protein RhoU [Echinococcus multilocularis]
MSEKSNASVKCILIGESGVGKTSLVVSYTKDDYPVQHEPTAFDTYVVDLRVENRQVNLQIHDAGGAPGVRSLRELAYPDVHVVIFCFSVVQPVTLWALRDRWLPELAASGLILNPSALETASRIGCLPPSNPLAVAPRPPGPAFILVGCACDLRNDIKCLLDLSVRNELPVNEAVAHRLAVEFGAEAYIECSALTQKQLKKVFDLAVWYGLHAQQAMLHTAGAGVSSRNSLSPPPPRGSDTSRKSKRQRHHSPMEAKNQAVQHPNDLCASQRSIWKKLLCLR